MNSHRWRRPAALLVAVGLSIDVPAGSTLVLYPTDYRQVNRFLTAGQRDSLLPHELPEVVLEDAQPVVISDAPGDVTMFQGSSMWHLRQNSAGAALLYLKCNDFDCDPLAEDPTTQVRRERTRGVLAGLDVTPASLVPVLGRRFQSVSREYGRDWCEDLWLRIFDEDPVRIDDRHLEVLRSVDGTRTWAALVGQSDHASEALSRLAELGAVDLVDPARR